MWIHGLHYFKCERGHSKANLKKKKFTCLEEQCVLQEATSKTKLLNAVKLWRINIQKNTNHSCAYKSVVCYEGALWELYDHQSTNKIM